MGNHQIELSKRNWVNVRGIAAHTGLSVDFFNKDRCTKLIGVPFVKLGRAVLYDVGAVDEFLASRMVRGEEV